MCRCCLVFIQSEVLSVNETFFECLKVSVWDFNRLKEWKFRHYHTSDIIQLWLHRSAFTLRSGSHGSAFINTYVVMFVGIFSHTHDLQLYQWNSALGLTQIWDDEFKLLSHVRTEVFVYGVHCLVHSVMRSGGDDVGGSRFVQTNPAEMLTIQYQPKVPVRRILDANERSCFQMLLSNMSQFGNCMARSQRNAY